MNHSVCTTFKYNHASYINLTSLAIAHLHDLYTHTHTIAIHSVCGTSILSFVLLLLYIQYIHTKRGVMGRCSRRSEYGRMQNNDETCSTLPTGCNEV